MFLNLWVATPLGLIDLLMGAAYQIYCISDIYIKSHNSSEVSYEVVRKTILWLGVTTTWGIASKGPQL